MLAEIASEVLRFLSRRDLDKACAVSKWLDALIAQCCDVSPLRPVSKVELYECWNSETATVFIEERRDSRTKHAFRWMDQAVIFAGAILSLSCVECLELSETSLLPKHAKTLNEAMRTSVIIRFYASRADFTALDNDAILAVVGCLRSLEVRRSTFVGGFAMDDMIRACAANGVLQLDFLENRCESALRFSDDAVLDFCFRAVAAPGQQSIRLELDGTGVSDLFITKFFERLLSSDVNLLEGWYSTAP